MASKPILSSIPAFDAEFGTDEAPILSFSLDSLQNQILFVFHSHEWTCKLTERHLNM